jgi:uncharacterized protein (DUF1501 family)
MDQPRQSSRRSFLRGALAVSSMGLASRLDLINLIATAEAQTAAASSYKALVCVFMLGGNDGNNTIIPIDTAGYTSYSAVRTAASGIQLPQASLLPIEPANVGTPYGLHPSLVELQTLFNAGKVAVLANVGTLTQPTTRAQYNAGIQPNALYSHADQQAQWQSCISTAESSTGWGGRAADQVAALNAASGFPVVTTLDGTVLFTAGASGLPLSIPTSGGFALQGYYGSAAENARLAAVKQLLAQASTSGLVTSMNAIGNQALSLSATVNPVITASSPLVDPFFASLTSNISEQLHQVAKMIAARQATGAMRQIFFVQLGSFDTHSNQLNEQQALFEDMSPALNAFYQATVAVGAGSEVTTFTLSDFNRTFQPSSGGGSDHAWGNHHFIIGDAVNGGNMYGAYPELVLGGPTDAEERGRWLPNFAVDQYGATLAKWFGVAPAAMGKVFPNLAAFANSDLGFMA